MNNLFISIIYLIISFILTIVCFKKYGKYGIYIWMCILVIICNIQTIKISELFGLTISLGNISYGAIFLSTDILSEKYGEKTARQATKLSFIAMIIFTILMQLFLKYEPSPIDVTNDALTIIFEYMPRVSLGSLLAYYISQNCDAKLYSYLKKKYNKIWLSNNVSTFISQIIDTIIFVSVAFIGVMEFKEIVDLMITMVIFKWLIAILDTPFIMLVPKIKNKEMGEEDEKKLI